MDDYVAIVGQSGGRVFFSPPYRSHDIFTDAQGRHYYEEREDKGRPGLKEQWNSSRSITARTTAGCKES